MNLSTLNRKAAAVTTLFTAFFVTAAMLLISDIRAALPLLFFSILLLINTFFSVRCFSGIPGAGSKPEQCCDIALGTIYLLLALSLKDAQSFIILTIFLFTVATLKYGFLQKKAGSAAVANKILIDAFCGLACTLTLCGVLAGFQTLSLVAWDVVFAIGNVYVLLIGKFYALHQR